MEHKKAVEITDSLLKKMNYKNRFLPGDFSTKMHSKFIAASHRTSFSFFRPALAMSLVLLVVFAAGFFAGTFFNSEESFTDEYFEQSVIASAEVKTGETVTIKLVYDSENDVEDVDFSITLPSGLAFNSTNPEISSEKTIIWNGSLKKGRNEIPFVVKATEAGSWQIDAAAEYDDGIISHEIVVKAVDEGGVNA